MKHAYEEGRWVAGFHPSGWARWFNAGFLTLWLAFWVVGEVVGLLGLLALVTAAAAPGLWRAIGAPKFAEIGAAGWFAVVFLLVWVSLWTFGGLAAIHEWLRQIAGEDRITWDASGIERASRAGPIRRRRRWSREEIERISARGGAGALTLHTRRAAHVLTQWGTAAERCAVRDELRRTLGTISTRPGELPEGWSSEPDPQGGTILRRDPLTRRKQAGVAWGVTIALAVLAVAFHAPSFARGAWGAGEVAAAGAAALVLAVLAAGSAWLSHGGTDYLFRRGALEKRGWFLGRRWSVTLDPVRLSVIRSTDSDGDEWLELRATAGAVHRVVERRMNDDGTVVRLARWLADRSGAPLEMDPRVDDEEPSAAR